MKTNRLNPFRISVYEKKRGGLDMVNRVQTGKSPALFSRTTELFTRFSRVLADCLF
jgi:hypothetical protein